MRIHTKRLVLGILGTSVAFLVLVGKVSDPDVSSREKAQRELEAKLKQWMDPEGKKEVPEEDINPGPRHVLPFHNTSKLGDFTIAPLAKVPSSNTSIAAASPSKVYVPYVETDSGHDNKVTRVWPEEHETEDRILSQMALKEVSSSTKKILVFRGVANIDRGNKKFIAHKCPITNCELTGDVKEASTADAILFEGGISEPTYALSKTRPPNQIWILFFLESPHHTMGLKEFYGKVNYTATYRRDSTMVTPYERWTQFPNVTSLPREPPRDYAKGKTKKVAWFVSNCGARNGRMEYAKELSKHIEVDIYGGCGSKRCSRGDTKCFHMLKTDYKFYLSFENSNCKDYITEKLYWNAFLNDVLPIVMGASPEDYKKAAPPGSFIHLDNFASPKALADYLHLLDSDDDLYNQYFRWKGTGEFIDTKWWCRLCSMVHQAEISQHKTHFKDLESWWRGPGVCVGPTKNMKWATWRNQKL